MSIVFAACCLIIGIHSMKIGPSLLPRSIQRISLGYDDATNTIWLIGGKWPYRQSLISFNLSIWNETNAMIDHGSDILPYDVMSFAQTYVQNKEIVYLADIQNKKMLTFNVSTGALNTMNTNPSSYTLNQHGCLASTGDWIIYTNEEKTYILTISTQTWKLTGNPVMRNNERNHHSCMIEPIAGYLYVIGGDDMNEHSLDSIEKIYINDILNLNQYTFSTLTDTLSTPRTATRAVLHGTDIFVIGGLSVDIDVIDTTTDSVSLWGNRLYEKLTEVSAIIIGAGTKVYIFGGSNDEGHSINYWQYFDVFSVIHCICCFIHKSPSYMFSDCFISLRHQLNSDSYKSNNTKPE